VYPELDTEDKEEQEDEDEDDLEASIAKEVAALKKGKGEKSPFIEVPTGTECSTYIISGIITERERVNSI
jgi:tRNA acetyltransferase TAN1